MGILNVHIFKDERGSTALTVLVAMVLVIALIAVSLQWYWTNTTSADIQHFADSGALAAAEATGRIVTVMQVLDVVLLTLNLFGLVVHAITIVAGVIAASGSPFSLAVAGFLPRAIEFDRKFVETRKKFSDAAFSAAKRANDAAPYLIFGFTSATVASTSALRTERNATSYRIIPVSFPAKGTVTRSGWSNDAEVMGSVEEASQKNSEHARRLKELENKRQAILDAAFNADIYRDPEDMRSTWKLDDALVHFKREFDTLKERSQNNPVELDPIDSESEAARVRLRNAYAKGCKTISDTLAPQITEAIGSYQPISETYSSSLMSSAELFSAIRAEKIFVLEHNSEERKAYHARENCTGLQLAQSELRMIELSTVIGDADHPPCSLCLPLHYGAVHCFENLMVSYCSQWNLEAKLIEEYNQLTIKIQDLASELRAESSSAFEVLLSYAQDYLSAGRLTYEPPGARGILCVAFSTSSRSLPRSTLPALTNSSEVQLGPQMALAGARLYPTKVTEVVKRASENINTYIREESPNVGGSVFNALDGENDLASMMIPIWKACTSAITRNDTALENSVGNLPWGVGPLLAATLRKLKNATGLAPPDTRTFKPFLVNTSKIGDPNAPGAEGLFVRNIRGAKKVYEQSGGASVMGLSEVLSESLSNYEGDIGRKIRSVLPGTFASGGALRLPFYTGLDNVAESSIAWAKGHLYELIGSNP